MTCRQKRGEEHSRLQSRAEILQSRRGLHTRQHPRWPPYHGAAQRPEPPQQDQGEQEHQHEQSHGHERPVGLQRRRDQNDAFRCPPSSRTLAAPPQLMWVEAVATAASFRMRLRGVFVYFLGTSCSHSARVPRVSASILTQATALMVMELEMKLRPLFMLTCSVADL